VRISIHLLLNSNRISRTTNIPAFASGCIREEIHKHLPFYIGRVTSVCRQSIVVLVHEGALAIASGVESFGGMALYDAKGNEEGREDTLLESGISDRFGHLLEGRDLSVRVNGEHIKLAFVEFDA
jgi:hypothetical protein